jgi:hypothetical protein
MVEELRSGLALMQGQVQVLDAAAISQAPTPGHSPHEVTAGPVLDNDAPFLIKCRSFVEQAEPQCAALANALQSCVSELQALAAYFQVRRRPPTRTHACTCGCFVSTCALTQQNKK